MEDDIKLVSSQLPPTQTSRYTYRHLHVLSSASPARESPLRVIALCDLDCFYAQVEGVRIKADPDEPLAVSQWGGLIAINYAARRAGITRHENAASAVQKCPGIRLVHVQTWKEGDTVSRYHDEPSVVDHKVSLDPYRRESRKILEIFKRHCDLVEKASIDESFLDLSTLVKERLLQRYGHLLRTNSANLDDPLPEAPLVNWRPEEGVLVDLDVDHNEEDRNDWDDVAIQIAAEIMAVIRADVKTTLGYTCSAGIARNKTFAKLAAGQNKPEKQTILRNRAVQSFINGMPLTKIRNLGGKLGLEVEKIFATSSAKDITAVSIEELRKKLGTETGQWLYNIVRGIDYSEVSTSTQVKSMLSAKSFRPQIDSIAQAERWIKVLTADLSSRLLEDPNQRRPKTLTMHHRVPGSSKTRQAPIPRGPDLTNEYLSGLAVKLLLQINTEGRAFPCFNLSLGLSGFEGLENGVQDIGGFFRKSLKNNEILVNINSDGPIDKFDEIESLPATILDGAAQAKKPIEDSATPYLSRDSTLEQSDLDKKTTKPIEKENSIDGSFSCERCTKPVIGETEAEHLDWHFAKDLAKDLAKAEHAAREATRPERQTTNKEKVNRNVKSSGTKSKHIEKGQKRLKFG
ncbi:Putative uncharacterized protein [Taphrina deformans PYCC 5710]|uniref:DNA polymerase eta n=1 Tax=Taphrina deformans (strain PYCC 5710 / ATCC 11124 / CBS 356.35 / IMI 108563 / JCM 9778 / NBRC 8474) TaxID=1097556 RepID=R4X8B2_TAPDE|nr:Putative uncharacterized protein [Taphrina deformans PYCC 5710]|eukprot:CCG81783.1 Putative uncharacterized protein [Taphrina deformans PYCC 5710]